MLFRPWTYFAVAALSAVALKSAARAENPAPATRRFGRVSKTGTMDLTERAPTRFNFSKARA